MTDAVVRREPSWRRRVWPAWLAASAVAVAAVVAGVHLARAIGVAFEVSGAEIPLFGFVWWAVVGAVAGLLLALVAGQRRVFAVVAAAGTVLSFAPAIVAPDDTSTIIALVALRALVATIVIPVTASRMPT